MENFEILPDDFIFPECTPLIPKKLHLIWVGDREKPVFLNSAIDKWKTLMPDWDIYLWENKDLTTTHFSPMILSLLSKVSQGAQKADILRYLILEKYGGIYVDADVIPHRSLDPIIHLGRSLVICHDLPLTWPYIAIGFIAGVPHHPVFQALCKRIPDVKINTKCIHMETGPRLFGDVVWNTKCVDERYVVLPSFYFYRNVKGEQTIHGTNLTDFDGRFGNHTYAKMWTN